MNTLSLYMEQMLNTSSISTQEQLNLFMQMKRMDKGSKQYLTARDKIVESNYRLVVHIAQQYQYYGLSFLDVIQEGNMGLIKAVENFDVSKNNLFSSYAYQVIKSFIMRALSNQTKMIRIPEYKLKELKQYIQLLSIDDDQAKKEKMKELGFEPDDIKELEMLRNTSVMPLDKKIFSKKGEEQSLMDVIASEQSDPEKIYNENLHKLWVEELLDKLTFEEKFILSQRYGFIGGRKTSYQNIGKSLNISKEWARKMELKALEKLKSLIEDMHGEQGE